MISDDPLSLGESLVSEGALVDRYYQKAMECFAKINGKPGILDIFLNAQIEVSR